MIKKRFEQRINSLPSDLWTKVAQIDELKGQWVAGIQLSSQVLGRLKRSILITSTGASTRIEGTRLSDEDVEKLMRGLDIQKFTDQDKQEVKGYFELLENVFNAWKSIQLSENTIKHFHQELLEYVKKDKIHRGEYKKNENKVRMIDKAGKSIGVLFDTTKAFLTPKEMQELVEWTKEAFLEKKNHPLLIIANFIVEFLQIHPFQDGNGRLSRILTNLLLLKAGYLYMPYVSHEKLIEDNKPDYYIALRKSQKTFKTSNETIAPWLDFFLEILLQQSKMAIELLSQENIEKILSVKQLAVWQYLQTVDEATPKEIVQKTKISRPTLNQVLDKLIRLKKIERLGLGRGTRYRKL
ncbi:MAG: Adenosine monophosphate-protein transferase SoFic [Candidatus Anoxychlamydiales bacterium]|nr:Adenosine monophosphate-protein transferase SoFic [Candidatus Anoxychlamydiales bacterium]